MPVLTSTTTTISLMVYLRLNKNLFESHQQTVFLVPMTIRRKSFPATGPSTSTLFTAINTINKKTGNPIYPLTTRAMKGVGLGGRVDCTIALCIALRTDGDRENGRRERKPIIHFYQ